VRTSRNAVLFILDNRFYRDHAATRCPVFEEIIKVVVARVHFRIPDGWYITYDNVLYHS
jgi:hypothetical protein